MIKFPTWRHKSPGKDWRVTGFPDDPSLVLTCLLFPETQEAWKEDGAGWQYRERRGTQEETGGQERKLYRRWSEDPGVRDQQRERQRQRGRNRQTMLESDEEQKETVVRRGFGGEKEKQR